MITTPLSEDLHTAVEAIKQAILTGQQEASKGVNRIQLAIYFAIGKYISFHTRQGMWGSNAIVTISESLRRELPGLRGFSPNSLKNMRKFYENWTILDAHKVSTPNSTITIVELQASQNQVLLNKGDFPMEDFVGVPFTHHLRILEKTDDIEERYYYLHRVAQEKWSIEYLNQQLKSDTFHHQGVIPNNFSETISDSNLARKAIEMFKDEYLLDFINVEEIGLRDRTDVDERVVEQEIVHNIKKFIMTFGKDFAFIGNQYHLEVFGVDHFPDLLFFNRELNALVVVELKTGGFKPAYLGQLTTYLRLLDDQVKKPHENASIGLILCKSANKDYVQYVIQDYSKPMGVATYSSSADMPENLRAALPDIKELQKLL